jgi:hypothetical protein
MYPHDDDEDDEGTCNKVPTAKVANWIGDTRYLEPSLGWLCSLHPEFQS